MLVFLVPERVTFSLLLETLNMPIPSSAALYPLYAYHLDSMSLPQDPQTAIMPLLYIQLRALPLVLLCLSFRTCSFTRL